MELTRREFVILTTGTAAALCAGCASITGNVAETRSGGPVDIGTAADYSRDGVYDQFSRHRFFVLRQAGRIKTLSAVCPHRRCTVRVDPGKGFVCPCHGATFDSEGKVISGPATSDLHPLQISEAADGHLLVFPEQA